MRVIVIIIAAAIGFGSGYFITLNQIPRLIMAGTMARTAELAGGWNQFIHPGLRDETSTRVVRPSPDLVYSACVIDLSDGPVRITSPMPDRYWSLSFFDANTDVPDIAQREEFDDFAEVIVATSAQAESNDFNGVRTIISPTSRGVALTRMFTPDRSEYPRLRETIQTAATCGRFNP